jgi:hypothetical protein
LHFDQAAGELRHITNDGTSVIERSPPPPRSIPAAFDNCRADLAGGVRWQRPFLSSAEDNLRTLAATLAAYDSVAQSTVVAPELV